MEFAIIIGVVAAAYFLGSWYGAGAEERAWREASRQAHREVFGRDPDR